MGDRPCADHHTTGCGAAEVTERKFGRGWRSRDRSPAVGPQGGSAVRDALPIKVASSCWRTADRPTIKPRPARAGTAEEANHEKVATER